MRFPRTTTCPQPCESPRRRGLSRRMLAPALVAVLVGATASLTAPAGAATEEAARKMHGYYEMPFPCGQQWTGKTWSSHSPSSNSVDWNRPDDEDDAVVASGPGTVTVANKTGQTGYGRYVQITHANREATLYAHLSTVSVAVGQVVDQGALVGTVGSTGNSTGAHLHFEQRSGSKVRAAVFSGQKFVYGATQGSRNCVDVPMAANMIGGAVAELVVFRRAKRAKFRVQQPGTAPVVIRFGLSTDEPLLGDWDGDGAANVAVRRPAESNFYLSTPAGTHVVNFGIPADRPIAGDWNGDGLSEIGVRRPGTPDFYLRHSDGSVTHVPFGDADDVGVTGDWNGDRVTDLGVYDVATATYTLRVVTGNSAPWTAVVPFGNPGDIPVTGDWDGNGFTDLGVWRPSTGTFMSRRAPNAQTTARTVLGVQFGRPRG